MMREGAILMPDTSSYLPGMERKNPKNTGFYWNICYKLSVEGDSLKFGTMSAHRIDSLIALLFEKFTICSVVARKEEAEHYYNMLNSAIEWKIKNNRDYTCLLYLILMDWLRNNNIMRANIYALLQQKKENIREEIIRQNLMPLIKSYNSISIFDKIDNNMLKQIKPSKSTTLKHPYEIIGSHYLELAKYFYLASDNAVSAYLLKASQEMFNRALELIPRMLSRRNSRWKEMEAIPDSELMEISRQNSGSFDYLLQMRKYYRGNIPLNRLEGEALNYILDTEKRKNPPDQFDVLTYLFSIYISPTDKTRSCMHLSQEILWVMLRQKLHNITSFREGRLPVRNSLEYLREYIGKN